MGAEASPGATLARLAGIDGPTGGEAAVADALAEALSADVDAIERDALGNVIARRSARVRRDADTNDPAPVLVIVARLDEPSLTVSRIDPGGFLRFRPFGDVDARALLGQPVTVHGRRPLLGVIGTRPPHVLEAAARDATPEIDTLFVDVGLAEADVRSAVVVGDAVTWRRAPSPLAGGRWSGKGIGARAALAALVGIATQLRDLAHPCDVRLVGAVQGGMGFRGAVAIGGAIGLAGDDTVCAVVVGTAHAQQRGVEASVALGGGPAIVRGPNVHPRMAEDLIAVARRHEVPHQIEAVPGMTRTEASVLQVSGAGIPTAVIGVPTRYAGTSVAVVAEVDIARAAQLVGAFALGVDGAFTAALRPRLAVTAGGAVPQGAA